MSAVPYLLYSDVHLHGWDAFASIDNSGRNTRLLTQIYALGDAYAHAKSIAKAEFAICAGDLFHQRGKIAPSVLIPTTDFFSHTKKGMGMTTVILAGNHDLETNEASRYGDMTQAIRSVEHAASSDFTFTDTGAAGMVAMVPWTPSIPKLLSMLEQLAKSALDLSRTDVIIHAPLDGVLRGVPEHGLTPEALLKACPARRIFCGHYHNHIGFGNRVYSVGALTHQTWSDVDTKAGYCLVYPDRVEHFETKAPKFVEIAAGLEDDEIEALAKGNYVRITVDEPTNEEVILIRNALTEMGAAGVLVKAVSLGKTERKVTTTASLERIEESVNKYAEERGGPKLAVLCEEILKHSTRATWSS